MRRALSKEATRLSRLHMGVSLGASLVLLLLASYALENSAVVQNGEPTSIAMLLGETGSALPPFLGELDSLIYVPLGCLAFGIAVNHGSRGARPLGLYLGALSVAALVTIDASILDWTGLIGERTGPPTLISFPQIALAVTLPTFALSSNVFALAALQVERLDERGPVPGDLVRLHEAQVREALKTLGETAAMGLVVGTIAVLGVRNAAGVDIGLGDNAALVGGLMTFVVALLFGRSLIKQSIHK
ncbi:MAG: hypothetical protein HY556_00930 [Euryarchaeota archaeon]|nr:hypothetical protein [Euryarchaeota archaeon]